MTIIEDDDVQRIWRDFYNNGYSYFQVGCDFTDYVMNCAKTLYDMDVMDRIKMIASMETGALGYYPSEIEAELLNNNRQMAIKVFSEGRQRGYSSYDFMKEKGGVIGKSPVFNKNIWNNDLKGHKEFCLDVLSRMESIAIGICSILDKKYFNNSLKISDALHQDESYGLIRLLKYPDLGQKKYSKPHTDYELITMIIANKEGLELADSQGVWRKIDNPKDGIVLLPGDMFEALSFGYIKSSLHRVSYGHAERLSVIYFHGCPLGIKIDAANEKNGWPKTFGDHIISMMARSSPHMEEYYGDIEKLHDITIKVVNPFKITKL